ncbi:MAG: YggS family pyridoxal phosphate-dependent enzyme [Chitinophagaceae bacterium]|nr:YggS family pyridoxal phosphate-dependent enzyme [Chitinophagaceae bacterium]
MPVNKTTYRELNESLRLKRITLVAVSKTKPVEDILELYNMGHPDFGENYVQELAGKQPQLPEDIRWHYIGHLQSNKVKYIAAFVHLIHGVDSLKLLKEINKQGAKYNRKISCLLQMHIAKEETKFGLDEQELHQMLAELHESDEMEFVAVCGLMGMASFTENSTQVREEFRNLKKIFDDVKEKFFYHDDKFSVLSMGMSGDYAVAVEEGSTMVRIGSLIFGERNYAK